MRLLALLLALTSVAFGGIAATGTAGAAAINGANATIDFSGMALEPYCVVIVTGGHNSSRAANAYGPLTAEGYTRIILDSTVDELYNGSGVWYKRMGGTPDVDVECYGTGNYQDGCAYVAIGLTGVDSAVIDAAATADRGYTTTAPSITTVTDSAWVLATTGVTLDDDSPGTIDGYTNTVSAHANDDNTITIAMATKMIPTAGAEDPGAFDALAAWFWCSFSVAIRPGVYAGASGAISAVTTPAGASLLLDGVDTDSVTPCVIGYLSPDDYVVKLMLAGYRDFVDTVTVTTDTVFVDETLSVNTFTIGHNPMMLMMP